MGGWALGIAAFLLTRDPQTAFTWAKVYYFFPLVISAALFIFAKSFPRGQIAKGWLLVTTVCFTALVAPLLFVRSFVTKVLVSHSWGKEIILNANHYALYATYVLAFFTLSLMIMYRKSKTLTGLYGAQALSFFVGFFVASLFGVIFNLILPAFGNYKLIWLGPLFTTSFVASIAYGIIRHKMFDIRLVLARSMSYATSLVIIATLYGFLVFGFMQAVLHVHFSVADRIYLSFATAIASLAFARFRKEFDRATNRVFYRDAYDPQELFDHLNRALVSVVDLERLLKECTELVAESLKAEYCAIGLHGSNELRLVGTDNLPKNLPEIYGQHSNAHLAYQSVFAVDYLTPGHATLQSELLRHNIAVLVRLGFNVSNVEEDLGFIILGQKKSGNPYNAQDFRVLDTIAKELVIAIQNALRFEEIENFNLTLQERVEVATRKLRRTNDKLRALDESKDDFISMASHQLRTPLTSVKGYLSMLLEEDAGKVNDVQREMLNQAFISSQRMVYLIADLLNVSRLKTGKFVIESGPVNLADVAEQELQQLTDTAASRQLTIQYDKPARFPLLQLDETKIRQVIMNFADNAIYYTPAGGHITVRLQDKPHFVELRIEDNGIGVPKSEQPHLFTKFYRAGNARKARPDGTGLGLFMAKKVVVAQGGALIFESHEGKGSVFGFRFPKDKAHLDSPTTTPTAVIAAP